MRGNSWPVITIALGAIFVFGIIGAITGINLIQEIGASSCTESVSGLTTVDDRVGLCQGGTAGQVYGKLDSGLIGWKDDATTAVTGAGAIAFDAGNDGDNSTGIIRITTDNDTNGICTESPADTILCDFSNNYPVADSATTATSATTAGALTANPADCGANAFAISIVATGDLTCASIVDADVPNTITIDNATLAASATALAANPTDCAATNFATTIAANGNLTCAQVGFSDLTGAATDAQVPDSITIDVADNATALAANPTDCASNTKADSINASGDLTCSSVDTGDIANDTILEADLQSIDAPVDEECLTYEATPSLSFEWQTCGGAAGNSFETIDAPLGTDPVASSSSDTLTLSSTSATVSVTGTAGTDTVDFGVTPDSITTSYLSDGADVPVAGECVLVATGAVDVEYATCPGGGSSIIFDIGDDGGNDSTAVAEIATSGDTNSIFTEPTADKILITVSNNWPSSDTATALAADPTDCGANAFAISIVASGNLTCATLVDADIPDSITISLAAIATALAANGGNCSAGSAPLGVDASGAVESCTDYEEDLSDSAGLAAALSDETGTGLAVFDTSPTLQGTVSVTGVGTSFTLNLDCTLNASGGALTTTAAGLVVCSDDDTGGGGVNTFGTVTTPISGPVVADSTVDKLTFDSPNATVSITGTAGTDTVSWDVLSSPQLTANGANCIANQFAKGVDAFGAAEACAALLDADIPDDITIDLATEATALAANPTDCGANTFATTIAATGDLTCASIVDADVPDSITVTLAASATALAANPTDCAAGTKADAIAASGNLTCTAVDISADTNLTAGRSLTLTGDDVLADVELYTVKKSINFTNPLTGANTGLAQFEYPTASTITEVSCSTDSGTVSVQLDERARATPNTSGTNVMTSTLVCDTDSQTTTSFTNAGIAADVPVSLQIITGTGSPIVVRIHIEATRDD